MTATTKKAAEAEKAVAAPTEEKKDIKQQLLEAVKSELPELDASRADEKLLKDKLERLQRWLERKSTTLEDVDTFDEKQWMDKSDEQFGTKLFNIAKGRRGVRSRRALLPRFAPWLLRAFQAARLPLLNLRAPPPPRFVCGVARGVCPCLCAHEKRSDLKL